MACTKAAAAGRNSEDSLFMQRIFSYKRLNSADIDGISMNVYVRHNVQTLKKNKALILIPTMYALARKKNNEFLGESYSRITFHTFSDREEHRHLIVGTLPRNRNTLPTMTDMLTPDLYGVTLLNGHLLSPFHRDNRKFYRYGISRLPGNRRLVAFVPKTNNTQTVKGQAVVDYFTGRIESVELEGEYDMISFHINATMGDKAPRSLLPKTCDMEAVFHMTGNRIRANYHTEYGLPETLPDSLKDSHSRELMDSLRPAPLTHHEQRLYQTDDSLKAAQERLPKKERRKNFVKHVLWDLIGDNLVNRIKGNFGPNDQGFFKIYPIIDPLSLSYSERKGFTYKVRLRGNYAFTPNQDLSLYFKGGYSFKQRQFYFRLPLKYEFDRRNNGFVELEIGNGNRITNSSVKQHLIDEQREDSMRLENMEFDLFKDTYIKLKSNYDLSNRWSIGTGMTYHRRSAVDKKIFLEENQPATYHSFAPMVQMQFRPWAWQGPILTLNYEQGIKGIGKCNMAYGRLEGDAIWLKKLKRLRSFSMRAGAGIYTQKDDEAYFLDFENFRENNMPGGWGDDWTGDFQLLKRDQYNSSEYYFRTNLTYESPLFFLSHTPGLGKYIEMERIYISSLMAKDIHPYTELGYGFTNRLFTIGLFVATINGQYDGMGCRFSLELFRDW